jgi:hypothetical protein
MADQNAGVTEAEKIETPVPTQAENDAAKLGNRQAVPAEDAVSEDEPAKDETAKRTRDLKGTTAGKYETR